MFKKLLTMLLIGLFTIMPILGGTGVVKAEGNGIKVDVKYVTGKYEDFRREYQRPIELANVYILANGEKIGEVPLNWSWKTYTYQGEYKDIDPNKEYTIEVEKPDFSYYDQYRQFSKWYSCNYDTDIQGSAEEGFTIVNTLMTNIHGKVSFVDGKYPSEIKINLLKNDEVIDTIVTDASKNWEYDFGKYCAVDDNGEEVVYNVTAEEIDGHYERLWGYDIEIVPCSTVTLTKELKGESKEKEFGVYILPNFESHPGILQQKLARRYPLAISLWGFRYADEIIRKAKAWDKISGSEPIYPILSVFFDENLVNGVMTRVNSGEIKSDGDLTEEEYYKGYHLVKTIRDWFILEGDMKYDTTVSGNNVDPDLLDSDALVKDGLSVITTWLMFKYAPDKEGLSWNSEHIDENGNPTSELSGFLVSYPYKDFQDYIDKSVKNNLYFYTTIKPGETKTVELPVENLYSLLIVENDYEDTEEPEAIKVIKLDRPVYRGEDYSDISFNNYDATLTNIGTPSPVDVTLTGKKTLAGRDIKDDEFEFELREGDKLIETVSNKGNNIPFSSLSFLINDVGVHTYSIIEKRGTAGGVTYDEHTENVTIEVTDNGDGTLKTDVKYDSDGAVFNNNYTATGKASIAGSKKLTGRDFKDDEFEFELKENGKLIETVTNKNGQITFSDIEYTLKNVGTHIYTISEKKGNLSGVEYDSHTETVTVDVTDNGDGTLKTDIKTDTDGVAFNNKYEATGKASIKGKKILEGKAMDTFTFELKEEDKVIESVTNDANGNFSFKDIEYTIKDIGTHTYTVTEKNDSKGGVEYDTHTETIIITVSDNGDGTLKTDVKLDDSGVEFSNKYSASGKAELLGVKTLTGKSMEEFEFVLFEDGKEIQTVKNDADGKITFDAINYSKAGTHTYTIAEKKANKPGITYDGHTETVTVEVTDNGDGTLKADIKYDADGIAFNNTYNATGGLVLTGKKTLEGKEMDTFSFELREGDRLIETATNDKNGNISFKEIAYTLNDVGTHTYTVTEVNDKKGGVTYDAHTETIIVEVTDNGDGTLKAEVTSNNAMQFVNKYAAGGSVLLTGTKKLTGKEMDSFRFELEENDKLIETVNNTESGQITFTAINYTLEDVGTHTYTITEVNDAKGGVEYDTHSETVKVEVTDNGNGTLNTKVVTDENGVEFNNKYSATGSITFEGKKDLEGKAMDTFEFTLSEDKEIETVTNDENGKIVFSTINYTLDDVGTHTYTVTEKDTSKGGIAYDTHTETITVEVTDNGDGTLRVTPKFDEDGVIFKNAYSATGKAVIEGSKILVGTDMKEFEFVLKEDGKEIAKATNSDEGEFAFPEIEYTLENIGEHTYTVEEVNTEIKGITYDEHIETVKINVTDNGDGTLKTEVVYDEDGNAFTNIYETEGIVELKGIKKLEGSSLKEGQFRFALIKNGETIQETANDAEGNFSFSPFPYNAEDEYKIVEINDAQENVIYDTHEEEIKIEATDNGDGTMEVTSNEAVFENKYETPVEETSNTPEDIQATSTGDSNTIIPLIAISVSAIAGILTAIAVRRKRR